MQPEKPVGRMAVLGLGVMGGSLARAVSSLGVAERVVGWSPESTERDAALTTGAVSLAAASWREAVSDADLVVLAVPPRAAVELAAALGDQMPAHATLTDVTSLKQPLERAAADAGLAERFVGAHPMAGAETSGFWASRGDLYEAATVWVVPGGAAESRIASVERLWSAVGARARRIEAGKHDSLMAVASHLPQLTSNALAHVIEGAGVSWTDLGPGGQDMTRLAASSAEMWTDLLRFASPELISGLRALGSAAQAIADDLKSGEVDGIERLMRSTKAWKGRA